MSDVNIRTLTGIECSISSRGYTRGGISCSFSTPIYFDPNHVVISIAGYFVVVFKSGYATLISAANSTACTWEIPIDIDVIDAAFTQDECYLILLTIQNSLVFIQTATQKILGECILMTDEQLKSIEVFDAYRLIIITLNDERTLAFDLPSLKEAIPHALDTSNAPAVCLFTKEQPLTPTPHIEKIPEYTNMPSALPEVVEYLKNASIQTAIRKANVEKRTRRINERYDRLVSIQNEISQRNKEINAQSESLLNRLQLIIETLDDNSQAMALNERIQTKEQFISNLDKPLRSVSTDVVRDVIRAQFRERLARLKECL